MEAKVNLEVEVVEAKISEDDVRGRCVEAELRFDYNGYHKTVDFFEYVNEVDEIDRSCDSAFDNSGDTEYIDICRIFGLDDLHDHICDLVQEEING